MDTEIIEDAKESLRVREGIQKDNMANHIGVMVPEVETTNASLIEIREWIKSQRLDAAIWTSLPPKFNNRDTAPSLEQTITYLRDLEIQKRIHAEEYIRRAPKQVDTIYRQAFEKEFGWTFLP